jgi:type IV pilus assembly protein PilO
MEERLKSLTFGKSILIGIALAAGYYFALYDDGSSLEKQIALAKVEVKKSKDEVANVRTAIEDAERFQQTMSVLGAEMDKVLKAIPAQLTSIELMKIISNEAKTVGAEINQLMSPQNFRNDSDKTVKFYEPVPIDVDLTGTYNQIMLFLSNLTKLDKIITTNQMSFNIKSGGATAGSSPIVTWKASLQAYRYISPTPETPPPGTPPKPGGAGG